MTYRSSICRRKNRKQGSGEKGFTIIELLASMTVLLISVVSIMAMQSTSLQTHITNQDQITANSLADQFMEVLQFDALRWVSTLSQTTYLKNTTLRPMSTTTKQYWLPYTTQPVNFQMSSVGASNQSGIRARFCLYYSYRWAGQSYKYGTVNYGITGQQTNEILEVSVLVLWARQYQGLPSVTLPGDSVSYGTLFSSCGSLSSSGGNVFSVLEKMLFMESVQTKVRRYFRQIRRSTFIRRDVRGQGT